MAIKPARKPQATLDRILKAGAGISDPVWLLGVRGYYRNSMGGGKNRRSIYDDAIFLVAPEFFASFNANTDPSISRRGVACLDDGDWRYKLGIHGLSKPADKRYTALVQASAVTVIRDNTGHDTGWFGINIHRGGYNSTSSLGCQTIFPDQWDSFISSVKSQLKLHGQKEVTYRLTSEEV